MFSSTETFDMTNSGNAYALEGKNNDRFTLKFSTAFILTFLAVVTAVGVGLLVHFAEGDKTITCQCLCSAASDEQVGCPPQTTDACKSTIYTIYTCFTLFGIFVKTMNVEVTRFNIYPPDINKTKQVT